MKNINLVPRKPFLEQWFQQLLITILVMIFLSSSLLLFFRFDTGGDIAASKDKVRKLQDEIAMLTAQRVPDPLSRDFMKFSADIAALQKYRHNWVNTIDRVAGLLPEKARTLEMSADDSSALLLHMHFYKLEDVTGFVALLKKEHDVENVDIDSINLMEWKPNQANTATDPSIPAVIPNPASTPSAGSSIDPFAGLLEDKTVTSKDEGNRALDELNWLIEQSAAEQEFGVKLPDKTFELPEGNDLFAENSTIFTPEEIEDAKQKLQEYKKQDESELTVETQGIMLYDVSLKIQFKPLIELEKEAGGK